MDPRHRDCLAFVRVCSGQFEKDMTFTNARTGKKVRLTRPQKVFARERESMDEALPGDVVGLNNPGAFAIGDTIYAGQKIVYPPIPFVFAGAFRAGSEIRIPRSPKSFRKASRNSKKKARCRFFIRRAGAASQEPVLAAVGELQFEVAQYRLKTEYGVETRLETLPFMSARWVGAGWKSLTEGEELYQVDVFQDSRERPVLLFKSRWHLERVEEQRADLDLSAVGT
jgi:peptide chain release factor 3